MNKLNLISIACGIGLCLASCSSDSEPEEPQVLSKALSIATSIQTKSVVTTAFANGDKMNLFVKSGSSASSEDYVASAVSASYNGNVWSLSPNVEIKEGSDAYVSAVFPYNAGNGSPAAVTISVESQTDYLYSGTPVKASYNSPQAVLTMKHALPIIAFNLSKEGVSEEVTLKSIKVSGEGFFLQGTLDVTNGKVTGANKGSYTLSVNQQVTTAGWKETAPECFCLPFNSSGQNISLTLAFEGREEVVMLPKLNVEGGMKYIFRLAVTPQGVSLFSDKTEVISLNKSGEGTSLNEYGMIRIVYEGTQADAPQITGKSAVSGTIYWGDQSSEAYQYPLSHSFTSQGEHQVAVECWGGESVMLPNLQQIAELDLSDF